MVVDDEREDEEVSVPVMVTVWVPLSAVEGLTPPQPHVQRE